MASRIVIDGNAFYEIDEDCMKRKREKQSREQENRQVEQAQRSRERGIWDRKDNS